MELRWYKRILSIRNVLPTRKWPAESAASGKRQTWLDFHRSSSENLELPLPTATLMKVVGKIPKRRDRVIGIVSGTPPDCLYRIGQFLYDRDVMALLLYSATVLHCCSLNSEAM